MQLTGTAAACRAGPTTMKHCLSLKEPNCSKPIGKLPDTLAMFQTLAAIDRDGKALLGDVERRVGAHDAHDAQTNKSDFSLRHRHQVLSQRKLVCLEYRMKDAAVEHLDQFHGLGTAPGPGVGLESSVDRREARITDGQHHLEMRRVRIGR